MGAWACAGRLWTNGPSQPVDRWAQRPEPSRATARGRCLSESKDPRAVEALCAALSDRDTGVRESAAYALGEVKDPRAVDALIAALNEQLPSNALAAEQYENNHTVRVFAARALAEIRDPRAVGPLIAALYDSDVNAQLWAIRGLGRIKDLQAVGPLIAALKYPSTRQEAADALIQLDDPRAVKPLSAAVASAEIKPPRLTESSNATARALFPDVLEGRLELTISAPETVVDMRQLSVSQALWIDSGARRYEIVETQNTTLPSGMKSCGEGAGTPH
jgi:HEAT repeat protein